MQVKVPQPLINYEDKVIGPFSFRQFIYIVLGLGLSVTVIVLFPRPIRIIGYFLAVPILAVFGALTFLKLQGRSPETMLKALIISLLRPRYQVWKKEVTVGLGAVTTAEKPKAAPVAGKKKVYEIRSSLEKLATIVDTSGISHEELPPAEAARVVRPEAEEALKAEEPEAKDVVEDVEIAANLNQAIEEVEIKAKPKPSEPVVAELSEPAKPYDYDYQKIELNPIAKEDELEGMVFQYYKEHPKRKLRILKHGERVQPARPLETSAESREPSPDAEEQE